MFSLIQRGVKALSKALQKTRQSLLSPLRALFSQPVSEETFQELERILYEADLGPALATQWTQECERYFRRHSSATLEEALSLFRERAGQLLLSLPPSSPPSFPVIYLIVGVNGSGKTTSLVKLAHRFQKDGKKVWVTAADTFRFAAVEQLDAWCQRLQLPLTKGKMGADAAAVVFDGLTAAKNQQSDVMLIDTAGRLQNKTHLLPELKKIYQICQKVHPQAVIHSLLVLDATTGQNGLDQVQGFQSVVPLQGVILTKLDGSAKGGVILRIANELRIPVLWVGTGEQVDDFGPFEAKEYLQGIFDERSS